MVAIRNGIISKDLGLVGGVLGTNGSLLGLRILKVKHQSLEGPTH